MAWRNRRDGRQYRSPLSSGVRRLRERAEAAAGGASPAIRGAGLALERAMKLKLSLPGTGRRYPRGTRYHIASAPGQPPAVDTGAGRNSIGHELVGEVLRVGAALAYLGDLEIGTDDIAARPWARPAFEEVRSQMSDIIVSEFRATPLPGA